MCRKTKFMLDLPLAHEHATFPLFVLISISQATVFYILSFTILYIEVCNVPEIKELNDGVFGFGKVVKVEFMSIKKEMSLWFLNIL